MNRWQRENHKTAQLPMHYTAQPRTKVQKKVKATCSPSQRVPSLRCTCIQSVVQPSRQNAGGQYSAEAAGPGVLGVNSGTLPLILLPANRKFGTTRLLPSFPTPIFYLLFPRPAPWPPHHPCPPPSHPLCSFTLLVSGSSQANCPEAFPLVTSGLCCYSVASRNPALRRTSAQRCRVSAKREVLQLRAST